MSAQIKTRKHGWRVVVAALVAATLVLSAADAAAGKHKKRAAVADRFAAIVIDAKTGAVLSEKNADRRLYPASMTKMMTLYLTFEAMESGRIQRDSRLIASRHAAAQEPSSLGLEPGESLRAEDAILAVVTKSANDVAVVLAEAVGGSESNFARAMTRKARYLGMANTAFVNASGLFHPAQVSTARDMAVLAQALMRDYPSYYRYFGTKSFSYRGDVYANHNKLLNSYPGMDGLKTGYVYASGYNLTASAVRNGTRLIGVVFGGRTWKSRNDTMARLLDDGFARAPRLKNGPVVAETHFAELPPSALPPMGGTAAEAEQGDAANEGEVSAPSRAAGADGGWAIQIGAFASKTAGETALQNARRILAGVVGGAEALAPLTTHRGTIYRARLTQLSATEAQTACRILSGHCLVMPAP